MASIMTEQTRENSVGSAWSFKFSFTPRSSSSDNEAILERRTCWKDVFRKRSSPSPSPSRFRRSDTSRTASTPERSASSFANGDGGIILSPQDLAIAKQLPGGTHDNVASSTIHRSRKPEQTQRKPRCDQNHTSTWPGRRLSSTGLRDLCSARSFAPEDLDKPPELSRPCCPRRVGKVWHPHPEHGWRVATKRRSPESVFRTLRPLYFANFHSPLITGQPFAVYFEGEIRPGDSEDAIRLALGFVAGEDRALKMPGCERWSLGVQCSEGRLFVNGNAVESVHTGAFEPGQRLGIGLNYAISNCIQQSEDNRVSTDSPSSIDIEVFITRDGKKIGGWKLCDQLKESEGLSFEGLEGRHDLYAAVGTFGEANVDILFKEKNWSFKNNIR